jgi:hypothetical protein
MTIQQGALRGKYEQAVDRESAFERLAAKAAPAEKTADPPPAEPAAEDRGWWQRGGGENAPSKREPARRGYQRQTVGEAMAKSVVRSVGNELGRQVGRQILRGVLGSILRR